MSSLTDTWHSARMEKHMEEWFSRIESLLLSQKNLVDNNVGDNSSIINSLKNQLNCLQNNNNELFERIHHLELLVNNKQLTNNSKSVENNNNDNIKNIIITNTIDRYEDTLKMDEEECIEMEEEEKELEEIEEVEEKEEEVEEVEVELTEFIYKKRTYYRDQENNVYIADDEGGVGDSIGKWDPNTKTLILE